MEAVPKWFKPVAIAALLWNLLGCAAYLADVMMSDEAVRALTSAERAIRSSRPLWVVSATAIAVWVGALGSVGLVMRRAWATPDLTVSLLAVLVQDIWVYGLSNAGALAGTGGYVIQGLILAIAIGLVVLAKHATKHFWIT